jgi:uncharacterized membrane protein YphA (DoxX/SURF4 family)
MKTKSIVYWTMTILVAFFIGAAGLAQIWQYLGQPHGVVPELGYPMYFFAILGFWKVLGAIAILVPRFPRLKEWAYAGIFFDLTGAAASASRSAATALTHFTSSPRSSLLVLPWHRGRCDRKAVC